jgi:hypothetical protein
MYTRLLREDFTSLDINFLVFSLVVAFDGLV